MFGSYGIYKDGIIIGIVARNELYFKMDNKVVGDLKSFVSEPFTYNISNKLITLSYWKVLPDILDQEEKLANLVSMAFDVSINSLDLK